jgi:uncharacterized membrane protein YeaQ/YmgE (transglycosylase-associated protein family)
MALIGFLIIGLIAGLLARAILPGRDPMGLLATMVLGCVGSFVGGFLAKALLNDNDGVGLIGSVVGAILVLFIWRAVVNRQRSGMSGFKQRVTN